MGDAERDDALLDDVLEPTEAPIYHDKARTDLFGAESDEEDGALLETQQVDIPDTQNFETQPFEPTQTDATQDFNETQQVNDTLDLSSAIPETQKLDSIPETQDISDAQGNSQLELQEIPLRDSPETGALDKEEGVQDEEANMDNEPENPDYQDTEPVLEEGENGEKQAGVHDDIFASDSDDEGPQNRGNISEAEDEDEEDEFEAMFKTGKKRKREGRTAEMVMAVESLIANMEVAAEMDIAANEDGKPAVHKIKQLAEVEDKVSQSVLHRELLDAGILGAMKLWIELMPDGSLPNVKVRTAVFRMLQKLPIDLNLEGRKDQLRKSELGKYVMFYSKLPDENLTNRQAARGLVEKWSRPIFDQYKESAQDEEIQERENRLAIIRQRRKQELERAEPKPESNKNLKPGDAGFRWHASIPAPARLDYMRRPENMASQEGEAVRGKAKPKDKMSKKLAAMSRKGGKKGGAEGKVSLQGRGLLL